MLGEFFVCDFCRTKYTAAQAKKMMVEGTVRIDRSDDTAKLLAIATAAGDSKNWQEAYDYANRALETDPESARAWFVKGKAAGWTSTLQKPRFAEMTGAFRLALQYSTPEAASALRHDCSTVLNNVAVAVQKLALRHAQEFVRIDSTWHEYLGQCAQIVSVLELAYQWDGGRQPLDDIIQVASNQIRGLYYTNASGARAMRYLDPAYEQTMHALIAKAANSIRERFDPNFFVPYVQGPKLKNWGRAR